ncbi:hypothetical protein [Nostoc sp. TCL26-01]|nr:hypothetical protein [Nostoc sp. TCL26-01]
MIKRNSHPNQQQKILNISLPKLDEEQLIQVSGGMIEIREIVIRVSV